MGSSSILDTTTNDPVDNTISSSSSGYHPTSIYLMFVWWLDYEWFVGFSLLYFYLRFVKDY